MTVKTYGWAGVSTIDGNTRFRVGKNKYRKATLEWHGHENVQGVELPSEMTEIEAFDYLKTNFAKMVKGVAAPVAKEAVAPEPKATKKRGRKAKMTLEEAMALVPTRENGKYVRKAEREKRAQELINS